MTGIDRLRAIAGAWDEWGLGGTLADIADEIERELDRHDEPDSTDKGARLLYVTDEDREALEWVRKYGGVGCVQTMAARLGDTLNWIRERAGVGEDEVVDYDELLDALDRRLVPEGMEWLIEAWPKFEDGEPVKLLDDFERYGEENGVSAVTMYADGSFALNCRAYSKGERVNRPAPKVLASDGEPLEVGQTVWFKTSGREMRVDKIEHRPESIWPEGFWALEIFADGSTSNAAPVDVLTHTKPEQDSLGRIADEIDRLREDVAQHLGDYLYDEDGNDSIQFSMECVAKRCRALAERERRD